jgi:hypothetical protein
MTADTDTNTAAPDAAPAAAQGKQRPTLPAGIVSPIAALNSLKQANIAPQDFKPQQMYGFVKNPGKVDAFPVRHYNATGEVFDTAQVDEHGITTTRPGVTYDEVAAWWGRKGERDAAKATAKAEKAKAKAEKEAAAAAGQPAAAVSAEEEGGEEVDAGEFEEAE